MTKSNKQDELAEALLRWAEEDVENRSVLVLADDESGTRLVYNGTELNLVAALAVSMRKDDNIRQACAKAMILLENCDASITNK